MALPFSVSRSGIINAQTNFLLRIVGGINNRYLSIFLRSRLHITEGKLAHNRIGLLC
jgi:hypothetical protein